MKAKFWHGLNVKKYIHLKNFDLGMSTGRLTIERRGLVARWERRWWAVAAPEPEPAERRPGPGWRHLRVVELSHLARAVSPALSYLESYLTPRELSHSERAISPGPELSHSG